MSTVTFKWPADDNINDIIVTGTFDNWSKTLPLVKRPDGSFELEVPIPKDTTKIEFKFVINGNEWVTSENYWTVVDSTGNVNNYIEFNENGPILKNSPLTGKTELGKTEAGKTEIGKTIIPESGLSIPTINNDKIESKNIESDKFTPTVMPSQEGIQTTLGEPGIVVPENSQEISAFKEVRNVDAKQLNADIKKEEEEKEKAEKVKENETKPKYVKKVKKLVPSEEAADKKKEIKKDIKQTNDEIKKDTKETPTSTSNGTPTPVKKEKKGFFSKFRRGSK